MRRLHFVRRLTVPNGRNIAHGGCEDRISSGCKQIMPGSHQHTIVNGLGRVQRFVTIASSKEDSVHVNNNYTMTAIAPVNHRASAV